MEKLGSIIFRKRKWVLVLSAAAILIFSLFALKLPTVLSGNGFEYNGEYNQTRKLLEKEFNYPRSSIILFFEKDKSISKEDFDEFIQDTLNRLKLLDSAKNISSPFEREGMIKDKYAYGILTFDKKAEDLEKEIADLKRSLKNKHGLKVTLTGEPIIVQDLNTASQEDLARAEGIGLPIALLVLILAFGGLVAAAIPIIIGVVSILVTMGTIYFFSYHMDLTIFILNIVPMIGLALSIDFALLFINRYKEELLSTSIQEAIEMTIKTAGRSIIFSGLCVFIGLSGLWLIKIDIFQNVALGGMLVVLISAISALTFLPALLALIGENIHKFSLFRKTSQENSLWYRFAKLVMNHPIIMSALALAILLGGLVPVGQMVLVIPGTDSLPENYPSRLALETFQEHFIAKEKRDEKKVTIILKTDGPVLNRSNFKNISTIIHDLERDKLVNSVNSPFSASGLREDEQLYQFLLHGDQTLTAPITKSFIRDNKMLVEVYLNTGDHDMRARQWVKEWPREKLGVHAYIGGPIKFEQEIFDEIYDQVPHGLLLIVLSTLIILMAAFRSILIPLKAILMNVLSLGCTFGIVVWIFQLGHLGMKPVNIALIFPVFVFTLVFGLSMDYEVFLISRIQEFYLKTGDNTLATISGLTFTSKIITSAAAIMIVVTGAFAFTGVMPVKQLGIGIAIAIFIDATIVRMVLVPALMKLLGDWNWWFFGYNFKPRHTRKKRPA
ncbi:MMPL family transporter [Bacillus sp. USDA818B3_A]|uniref:MMPL family transporter n=1 Tax=Bacillus sp. USDA818B3_A TaxID=2698834 RepID=UPI00136A6231|nr:MMPL family transporter [Bacillus sp. USDA818B3_A]